MAAAYEPFRADGVLPASYEAVFGQAWGALKRGRDDGEFSFPVSAIGRRGAPS
jgi:malonyl-CoA O-methyltransferase